MGVKIEPFFSPVAPRTSGITQTKPSADRGAERMGTAVILFASAMLSFLPWLSLASWPWAEQLGLAAGPCVMPLSSTISYLTSSPMMAHLLLPAQTFCSLHPPPWRAFHFPPSTSTLIGAPAPPPHPYPHPRFPGRAQQRPPWLPCLQSCPVKPILPTAVRGRSCQPPP